MSGALPPLADKEYFSMGEAAKIAQVPAHTLRYWESRFGGLNPSRLDGGHRRYSRENLDLILAIKRLVHDRRMTIAGARKALFGRSRKETDAAAAQSAPAAGSNAKLMLAIKRELKNLVREF